MDRRANIRLWHNVGSLPCNNTAAIRGEADPSWASPIRRK